MGRVSGREGKTGHERRDSIEVLGAGLAGFGGSATAADEACSDFRPTRDAGPVHVSPTVGRLAAATPAGMQVRIGPLLGLPLLQTLEFPLGDFGERCSANDLRKPLIRILCPEALRNFPRF